VIEFLPEEISGALEYPFKNREKWPEKYRKGHEYLEANNKYCLKALKDQGRDWYEGVPEEKHKFVPFNGALGDGQLEWIKTQLSEAKSKKQLVCMFGHIPLTKNIHSSKCILWDSEKLQHLLKENGQHTAAYIAGHTHRNYEFYQDDLGNDVRCIQIASPLLAQPNEDCFGILEFEANEEVIDDKTFVKGTIKLNGSGAMQTTVIEKEYAFKTI